MPIIIIVDFYEEIFIINVCGMRLTFSVKETILRFKCVKKLDKLRGDKA